MAPRPVAPIPRVARLAALGALVALAACGGGDGATAPSTVATLRVVNGTASPITRLFWQRCTNPLWGPDRLEGRTIAPGATLVIDSVPSGCYDLRADADGGRRATRFQQNLAGGATYEWPIAAVALVADPR